MSRPLRQSTSVDVPIGPFVDSVDGVTAETALTITQPDVRLKKNAAAWAQKNAAQTLTHEENGFYEVTLDATDTNTLGLLRLAVFEGGAAPVWEDFDVLTAEAWDALYAGTGVGVRANVQGWLGTAPAAVTVAGVPKVDVTHWSGTAAATPTVAGVPEVDITHFNGVAGTFAAGRPEVNTTHWRGTAAAAEDTAGYPKITIKDGTGAGEIDTNAGQVALTAASRAAIVDEVWDELTSGHLVSGSYGQAGQIVFTGTATAGTTTSITLPGGASATSNIYRYNIAQIVAGTGAGQAGQIIAYNGGTKVATIDPPFAVAPAADSVVIIRPFGIDAATIDDVVTAVWDAPRASHVTAGTFGEYTPADIVKISNDSAAADNLEAMVDGTGLTLTNVIIPGVTAVQADVDDIQTRLPATLDSGRMRVKVEQVVDKVLVVSGTGNFGIGAT